MFVEILEKMQKKIDSMEEQQKQLLATSTGRIQDKFLGIVLIAASKRTRDGKHAKFYDLE